MMTMRPLQALLPALRRAYARTSKPVRIGISVGCVIGLASCATQSRVVFQPPHIPGAEYIGSGECALCHEEINTDFQWTAHARLVSDDERTINQGCEACHGPGSLHYDEGGTRASIHNPGRSSDTCLTCHQDVRSSFLLPHSHPVRENGLACIDCHDPHVADVNRMDALNATQGSGACAECHTEQSSPHVFEHEAMREGCQACHNPHGSVNDKMLKVRNANLCLQCHYAQDDGRYVMIGEVDHTGFQFLSRGTCWTAGCHEAVHGSNVNSSLRY